MPKLDEKRIVSFFVNDKFLRSVSMHPNDITLVHAERAGNAVAEFVYSLFDTRHHKFGSKSLRRRRVHHLQYHCNDERFDVRAGELVKLDIEEEN